MRDRIHILNKTKYSKIIDVLCVSTTRRRDCFSEFSLNINFLPVSPEINCIYFESWKFIICSRMKRTDNFLHQYILTFIF